MRGFNLPPLLLCGNLQTIVPDLRQLIGRDVHLDQSGGEDPGELLRQDTQHEDVVRADYHILVQIIKPEIATITELFPLFLYTTHRHHMKGF